MDTNKLNSIINERLPQRIVAAALGLMLCGVGVSTGLFSGLGVDPASVFQQGLANMLNISYGMGSALMNMMILLIVFFIDRKYINIGTAMAIFLIGFTAEYFSKLLGLILDVQSLHLVFKLTMVFVGCAIMSIGIAIYIRSDLGVGAVDLVSEITSKKFPVPYRWVRIAWDIIFVVTGYFMGGTVGVGTVIMAFCTGPIVQYVRPFVYKIMDPFVNSK